MQDLNPETLNPEETKENPLLVCRDERIMSGTMLGAVVLWVLGDQLGVPAVTAAMLGLCSLLASGVLKWRDCLDYSQVLLLLVGWDSTAAAFAAAEHG